MLCPYCSGTLLAKKGRIKRHHFAHNGAGCTQHFSANFFALAGKLPTQLPMSVYAAQKLLKIEDFYQALKRQKTALNQQESAAKIAQIILKLEQNEDHLQQGNVAEIKRQVKRYTHQKIAPFPDFHTLRSPFFKAGYTDGKRTCQWEEVTLDRHEYYYPIAFQKEIEFLHNFHRNTANQREITDKLVLFEKDFNYFQQFQLYFLELEVDYQKIYKIGLTSRNLATRIKEIEQTLKSYYLSVKVKILFLHSGVAFLETFFKNKYAEQQVKIGSLTEYFSFSEPSLFLLLKDLNLLKIKGVPHRASKEWIDWIYFNFTGKIYGYHQKSVYIKGVKWSLSEKEAAELRQLMDSQKHLE